MDYREAGVDISAADAAKDRIKALARSTFNPSVLTEIGSFGGMFRPDLGRYREPVLVASSDGVGTKIRVAVEAGVHDTVGYDLVAHCVDDILVQGALPLFFLDYVALGKMDPVKVEAIVSGFARACAEFGCPLLGGETAEMPGTYAEDDYDLAGFIVGILEKERALPRGVRGRGRPASASPRAGSTPTATPSPARSSSRSWATGSTRHLPELGATVGEALLAPHRSYLAAFEPLLERDKIRALAHITGGGFPGNIPRVLPEGLGARVRRGSWDVPALFRLIQKGGEVSDEEMYRTFNMGIGMIAVVSPGDLHEVEHSLERRGETSFVIGSVVEGTGVSLGGLEPTRKIGVLISGRGSNLQALIDAQERGELGGRDRGGGLERRRPPRGSSGPARPASPPSCATTGDEGARSTTPRSWPCCASTGSSSSASPGSCGFSLRSSSAHSRVAS